MSCAPQVPRRSSTSHSRRQIKSFASGGTCTFTKPSGDFQNCYLQNPSSMSPNTMKPGRFEVRIEVQQTQRQQE